MMVNEFVNSMLSALAGALFMFLIGAGKRFLAGRKALKALAHDSLFRYCRYLIEQGSINASELENLEYLFDGYHSLGLNGTGEELYHRAKDLPYAE
jgi:hypothetical protein